jgi:rRNA maturation protein Nop10
MSSQYRICHNCGASLTPGETYCPHCGAQYVEPFVQKPGEFDPFPPEQANASAQTEPYLAQPQQPVVLPPPQQQAPYPPQGQGYVPPSAPSSYASGGYGQQTPGQVGGSPQPPESDTSQGISTSLIIGLVFAGVFLLLLVGGLFYFLGQRNTTTPGTTPTPGVTPTSTPTPTPGTTPTPTPTSVPFQVTTIDLAVSPLSIAGMSCGTQLTVKYTATFHVLAKGPGGAVQFTYTSDGGKTHMTAVVQFSPGQTSNQYQITSSGTLSPNGAFPGAGQITTTSPNSISSQAVTPSGTCTPVPTATP